VIDSPLAQPRNAMLSQAIASLVGVAITKLFQHSPHFESLRFVAGALSVGIASAIMTATKTVHPPAGATALLASTSPDITALGWFFVPLIILGMALMLAVACVVNNIQRTFPEYWWTPMYLAREGGEDIEKAKSHAKEEGVEGKYVVGEEYLIRVDGEMIVIPEWMALGEEEKAILQELRNRLARAERGMKWKSQNSGGSDETQCVE